MYLPADMGNITVAMSLVTKIIPCFQHVKIKTNLSDIY